ncbi:MAG TPA: hypothetical protein VHI12_03590 [Gaiellaceae bacterium]|nr:hypothetical protein [Gaiellaceae bacterium]
MHNWHVVKAASGHVPSGHLATTLARVIVMAGPGPSGESRKVLRRPILIAVGLGIGALGSGLTLQRFLRI